MQVAITGTPGTGKTTVTDNLGTDHRIIHLTEYIEENQLGEQVEGVNEVEIEQLRNSIEQEVNTSEDIIFEGHLAHHLEVDLCIVLRCNPEELEQRLGYRDYSDSKVKENVEAEALDVILSEAVQLREEVLEVDTTGKEVEEVVAEVKKGIDNKETGYGDVDWSKSFQALF